MIQTLYTMITLIARQPPSTWKKIEILGETKGKTGGENPPKRKQGKRRVESPSPGKERKCRVSP